MLALAMLATSSSQAQEAQMVGPQDVPATSTLYVNNRAPLRPNVFIKLPLGSVKARGWVGEMLRRESEGLAGRLGEISDWLDKKGNAWLEEGGSHGWEEVPYWLRGYHALACQLADEAFARLGEANDRRCEARAFRIRDDRRFAAFHDSYYGVCCT